MRTKLNPQQININGRIEDLVKYFNKVPYIIAAYLYGSYGTKYQTPLSDVDIAVLVAPDKKVDFQEELEIAAEITSITGEDDVNLLIINNAPVNLQYNIISAGKLLFEKEPDQISDFIEKTIKKYGDYSVDMNSFYKDYDFSLKEAYCNGQK